MISDLRSQIKTEGSTTKTKGQRPKHADINLAKPTVQRANAPEEQELLRSRYSDTCAGHWSKHNYI